MQFRYTKTPPEFHGQNDKAAPCGVKKFWVGAFFAAPWVGHCGPCVLASSPLGLAGNGERGDESSGLQGNLFRRSTKKELSTDMETIKRSPYRCGRPSVSDFGLL